MKLQYEIIIYLPNGSPDPQFVKQIFELITDWPKLKLRITSAESTKRHYRIPKDQKVSEMLWIWEENKSYCYLQCGSKDCILFSVGGVETGIASLNELTVTLTRETKLQTQIEELAKALVNKLGSEYATISGGESSSSIAIRKNHHRDEDRRINGNSPYSLERGYAGIAWRTFIGPQITAQMETSHFNMLPAHLAEKLNFDHGEVWLLKAGESPADWNALVYSKSEAEIVEILGSGYFYDPHTNSLPAKFVTTAKMVPAYPHITFTRQSLAERKNWISIRLALVNKCFVMESIVEWADSNDWQSEAPIVRLDLGEHASNALHRETIRFDWESIGMYFSIWHGEVVKKELRYWHWRQLKEDFEDSLESCNIAILYFKGDKTNKTNRKNGKAIMDYLQSLPQISLVTGRGMQKW